MNRCAKERSCLAGRRQGGVFLVLVLALGAATFAHSQGGARGAITGTVKDTTEAVVPGATVKVISQATNVTERTLFTDTDGNFSATLLPVGTYRVEVSMSGFSTTIASDVAVRVAETTTLAIKLKIGQIAETVTVTEAQAPVRLTSPATGETIQNASELPLATRNFLSLLALSTGANSELADTTALGRGQVSINVNGQRPVNNNFELEGINANDFNLPVFDNVPLPNPDTVQEFKTQTSLYDASQGRNGGGNIQVTLKSGGSHLHGNAFEYFRNNVLNANDFFLNRDGQPRPVLRQNQFGFSLGGPIPVAKDFFFFANYQGTRAASAIANGTTINSRIPTLPADRSAANLQSIFFPNGLPPSYTSLDPTALAFLNLPASKCPGFNDGQLCIPSLPGTPGLTARGAVNLSSLTRASVGTFDDNQGTLSIDKQLGTANKISGRFFAADFAGVRPFGTGASTLPVGVDFPNTNRFLKLGWTRELSSTMVNDARFGFNRFTFNQLPEEQIMLSDVGAVRGNSAEFPAAYRVNIANAFSLGTGVNDNRGGAFNTFVWADDYSWSRGKHILRFGGEIDRYQLNRYNNFATRGSVTFGNTVAGLGGPGVPSLDGFQNFLLGRITGTQGGSGFTNFYFRAMDAALYVQDDWKVLPRLTLNLGLRWEGLSTAHEKYNYLSNFAGLGDGQPGPISIIHPADTPRVGTPGVSDCTLVNCFDDNNFAPRFGFAWDVLGNHKTSVRGGYGIYYQRVSNQSLLQASGGLPFQQTVSAAALTVTPQNPFPTILPISAFPLPTDQIVPKLVGFNGSTGAPIFNSPDGGPLSGFFFFPVRGFKAPYAQQWNLTVEHEIYKGWVAAAGYVGTRGVSLLGPGRPLDPSQFCSAASPCVIPSNMAARVVVPTGTPGVTQNADGSIAITQSTADNKDARVPAQYLGLANNRGFFQENGGSSSYHSLQASVSHRYANSLYFQGAYTFSKAIDNGSGSTFQDELNGLAQYGDLFNLRSNRGLSDFDRTHRLMFSYEYELPFAKWAHLANSGWGKLANGWSILGMTVFQSGTPFIIIDSSALTLQDTEGNAGPTGASSNYATLAPGASLSNILTTGSTKDRLGAYINLSAFTVGGNCVNDQNAVVPCGSADSTGYAAIGNVGRNTFRGPFQQNWDMSFIKRTKLTEESNIEFRAEMFNIFNHAAFQSPQAAGAQFGNYGIVDIAGGDSSILATVNRPRIIQFALKFNF
jgi:hypothetical protein